jgi:hypothetical protein
MNCLATPTQRTGEPEAPARASVSERFRRLKWNEVVWSGDFVADERLGFELWEAPGRIPSRLVCETNLPEGRDREIPTNLNQKTKTKRKSIAVKTPKITARLRYHKQSVQLH